jgi:hypothetical protein
MDSAFGTFQIPKFHIFHISNPDLEFGIWNLKFVIPSEARTWNSIGEFTEV